MQDITPEAVVIGVDTHKDVHVAVAINGLGARLGTTSVPVTSQGYKKLADWATSYGVVHAIGIEGIQRLVEQPQWLARSRDAGQHRFLPLPGRQQGHRNWRQVPDAHRVHRGHWISLPESQRPAQRQLPIKCEIVVGQRQLRWAAHRAAPPQKARDEAKQARLAAAVRPSDMKRLARRYGKAQLLEQ